MDDMRMNQDERRFDFHSLAYILNNYASHSRYFSGELDALFF